MFREIINPDDLERNRHYLVFFKPEAHWAIVYYEAYWVGPNLNQMGKVDFHTQYIFELPRDIEEVSRLER